MNVTTPMVFIGNNRYETKLFALGKRAALDEGELWVYLARDAGRFGFVRLALRALVGRLDDSRDFQGLGAQGAAGRGPPARAAASPSTARSATSRRRCRYRIRPRALRVIVPR